LRQDQTDRRLYKFPSEKGKGVLGSVVFHTILIVVLLISAYTSTPPLEEEGILVNFGMDESGSGFIEPSPSSAQQAEATPVQESTPVPQTVRPVSAQNPDKAINTQEFDEEAPVVKRVVTQPDPEAEKRRLEALEAEKKRLADLEIERKRVEAEEIERKRIAEEKRREQEIADRMKNVLSTGRNTGTTSTGEGATTGTGNQGVQTGSVDARVRGEGTGLGTGGTSYNLAGRSAISVPEPKYDYQGEGIVVVEVTVDRTGKVISAREGVRGTTTLDEYFRKVAKEAALQAKFDVKPDAPNQVGTITYYFKLR
jgi:colicin import membrane protein